MLFSSFEFLLVFLPATFLGFAAVRRMGWGIALSWLSLTSLLFYAWWSVPQTFLLIGSIAVNFAVGRAIISSSAAGRRRVAEACVLLGVVANLAVLGYFKYANFFLSIVAPASDLVALKAMALPLGISFFTFTQIAFLVDASKGQFPSVTFSRYLLFVSFFPHLIAGPIVHFRQLSPQFASIAERRLGPDVAIGLTFFAIGLFKKVVLADSIARYVGPVFSNPGTVTALEAWLGVLCYTMQIYFDFSGYSDMAIGLARMFGIRFPVNFASPYKATSIVDFWRRWHITLSSFLRDYLYIPLGGNRHGKTRRYLNLAVTMVLGGLWHGAAWTFVAWGALHGAYLIANQAWIAVRTTLFPAIENRGAYRLACRLVTFLAVVVAWTFFRADSVQSATQILQAMVGAKGFALPLAWHAGAMRDQVLAVVFMIAIVMWAPNSQELVDRFRVQDQFISIGPGRLSTMAAAVVVGMGWVTALLWLYFATSTEFIYYNF